MCAFHYHENNLADVLGTLDHEACFNCIPNGPVL